MDVDNAKYFPIPQKPELHVVDLTNVKTKDLKNDGLKYYIILLTYFEFELSVMCEFYKSNPKASWIDYENHKNTIDKFKTIDINIGMLNDVAVAPIQFTKIQYRIQRGNDRQFGVTRCCVHYHYFTGDIFEDFEFEPGYNFEPINEESIKHYDLKDICQCCNIDKANWHRYGEGGEYGDDRYSVCDSCKLDYEHYMNNTFGETPQGVSVFYTREGKPTNHMCVKSFILRMSQKFNGINGGAEIEHEFIFRKTFDLDLMLKGGDNYVPPPILEIHVWQRQKITTYEEIVEPNDELFV